jgi:hypothetical protein
MGQAVINQIIAICASNQEFGFLLLPETGLLEAPWKQLVILLAWSL